MNSCGCCSRPWWRLSIRLRFRFAPGWFRCCCAFRSGSVSVSASFRFRPGFASISIRLRLEPASVQFRLGFGSVSTRLLVSLVKGFFFWGAFVALVDARCKLLGVVGYVVSFVCYVFAKQCRRAEPASASDTGALSVLGEQVCGVWFSAPSGSR